MALLEQKEFDALPDDRLGETLFDRLHSEIPWSDAEAIGPALAAMPPGQRALAAIYVLTGEVNNGGFNQFFFNNTGNFAEEAADGFRLIGAAKHAKIVEAAMERVLNELGALDYYWSQRTLEAFSESYGHTTLGQLDDVFYALPDPYELLNAYIRENPGDFVANGEL